MVVPNNNKPLQVVLLDTIDSRRRTIEGRLRKLQRVGDVRSFSDLSGGFNDIEHNPPDLMLVSHQLSLLAEFDAVQTLCRCLSVKYATFAFSSVEGTKLKPLDFARPDPEIERGLFDLYSGDAEKATRATAGLLRAPSAMVSDRLVLIGSSTGGLEALLNVLGSFPRDCPGTVIVQHTGASFSSGFAKLLNSKTEPEVRLAEKGEVVSPGKVLVAPGPDTHLCLAGGQEIRCNFIEKDLVSGHRPSVDMLFSSAVPIAPRVTGVILTGMGRDGAEGLLQLRRAGARTIGQDEATSVVHGMPKVAAELGAVERVLPLGAIGPEILKSAMGQSV